MFVTLGRPKSLKNIIIRDRNKEELRSKLPIAIIDDEKFAYAELLRNLHFIITELGDIKDIKAVSEYEIVLCDIRGVGKAFGGAAQGGHVIHEIKLQYPYKYVIAYTAYTFDMNFQRYFDLCDSTIKKDADTEDWSKVLDRAIEEMFDPIKKWIRIRTILLKKGIELYDVFKLEQAYIKAISSKEPNLIKLAAEKIVSPDNTILLKLIGETLALFVEKLIACSIAGIPTI